MGGRTPVSPRTTPSMYRRGVRGFFCLFSGRGPRVWGGQDPGLAEDDPLDVPAVAGDVLGLVAGQGPLDERVDVPLFLDFLAVEGGALGAGLEVDRVAGDGAQLLEGGGDQEDGRRLGQA